MMKWMSIMCMNVSYMCWHFMYNYNLFVSVYIYVNACISVWMIICTCLFMYECMNICFYVYVCMCKCSYECRVYIYLFVYILWYSYVCMDYSCIHACVLGVLLFDFVYMYTSIRSFYIYVLYISTFHMYEWSLWMTLSILLWL